MALQYSTTLRSNQLNQIESTVSTAPLLRLYDLTAGAPADCAAAITATLVAEMTLPSDWLTASTGGSAVAKSGTWEDLSANNAGTLDFWRIWDSTGTTCHLQGTVTLTAGGGDITVDNTSVTAGQSITVTAFSIAAGNA